MNRVYVLWGRKKGEPVWMEAVLCETCSMAHLMEVKSDKMQDGYVHFRIAGYGDEMPNFKEALKI